MLCWSTNVLFHFVDDPVFSIFTFLALKVCVFENCIQSMMLHYIVQVIPEYQRAVIFRLGRVKDGNVKGPGKPQLSI